MPTLLDLSPQELDNPLAPHVIRRQQEQQNILAQQAAAQLEQQRAQQGQREAQIDQAAQPGLVAQAQQQSHRATVLPIEQNDIAQWMVPKNFHREGADPSSAYETGNPYAAPFAQAAPEARQHVIDAYGPQGIQDWNDMAKQVTGLTPETGAQIAQARAHAAKAGMKGAATANLQDALDFVATAPQPPSAHVREAAVNMGVYKEGDSEEALMKKMEDKQLQTGEIPERLRPTADKMAAGIVHDPILGPYAKQKAAYDTMKSGLEDSEGGFSDMALIEGFQRIVNPGAVVRQATMNNMLHAAGLGQYGSWDFLVNKLQSGDKLSAENRQKLMRLADTEYTKATKSANRALAGLRTRARMEGIENPEFVNNLVTYVGTSPDEAQPAAAATPSGPQPDISQDAYNALPSGADYWHSGRQWTKQ